MASAATQPLRFQLFEQPIPADSSERLALASQAWAEFKTAEADVQRIDQILREGELTARRHNISRADQFNAWTRQTEAEKLLVRCLGLDS